MAVAVVQTNFLNNSVSATSHGTAYTSNVTSGNTLIAIVSFGSSTITTTSITDTLGNTWSLVKRQVHASSAATIECWKSESIGSSGANTVTTNYSASSTSQIRLYEVSGSSPVVEDQSVGVDETSDATWQRFAGITTTKADSIVLFAGRVTNAYAIGTPPTGYTVNEDNRAFHCYKILSSTGTENPQIIMDTTETGSLILVNFGYSAPSTYTGSAAVSVGHATASASGTVTNPTYSGSSAVSTGKATASGSGTFSVSNNRTASAAVTVGEATASGVADRTNPATAAVTIRAVTCNASGVIPRFAATGAVTAPAAIASGQAHFIPEVITVTAQQEFLADLATRRGRMAAAPNSSWIMERGGASMVTVTAFTPDAATHRGGFYYNVQTNTLYRKIVTKSGPGYVVAHWRKASD